MLEQFYAVTHTSVYHVKAKRSKKDPTPFAKKIALNGQSAISVGEELKFGPMIAITKSIQTYIPEGGGMTSFERSIEHVNTRYWIDNSSYIVALFTDKNKAMDCFSEKDLRACDSRWIDDTKNVIKKIGENHPVFEVCKYPAMSLLSPNY